MSETEFIALIAMFGGFCAGVVNAWAWLIPMSSDRRDNFLMGVKDGINPLYWWRVVRGK